MLVNFGVTHVFGGNGGAIVALVDAIEAHPKLTWVYNRCEVRHDGKRCGRSIYPQYQMQVLPTHTPPPSFISHQYRSTQHKPQWLTPNSTTGLDALSLLQDLEQGIYYQA